MWVGRGGGPVVRSLALLAESTLPWGLFQQCQRPDISDLPSPDSPSAPQLVKDLELESECQE